MKHAKRLLALLLTLALAFGLTAPIAFAQDQSLVDWDDFYAVGQLQPFSQFVSYGDSFTVSAEVNIPDGVDEVVYRWYRDWDNGVLIEGAAGPALRLGPKDSAYPSSKATLAAGSQSGSRQDSYYCEIIAYEKDGGGAVIAHETRRSSNAYVRVEGSFWQKLYSVTVEPFAFAAMMSAFSSVYSLGLWLPLIPFAFAAYWYERLAENFRGLFSVAAL